MKLVSIKEISEFLKVKEPTLYSWVRSGTLPSYKLKGLLRFDMDEIKEWVKDSRFNPCNVTIPTGKSMNLNIDTMIKRAVEDVTGKEYNPSKRETSLNQGLRKEE